MPEHFVTAADHATFRPRGRVSLDRAITLVGEAITYTRQQDIRRLLADVSGLSGFGPPNTLERYGLAKYFAEKANSQVIVALVAPDHLIDPERFGVVVARSHGMVTDVFTDEAEALAWLADPRVW